MTDDREDLRRELRPLIGAHADIVANHLAAAGFRRHPESARLADQLATAERERAVWFDENSAAQAALGTLRERVAAVEVVLSRWSRPSLSDACESVISGVRAALRGES